MIRAPCLPFSAPDSDRQASVRGKDEAVYLRVSEWGGLDSNQRPTDYESAALTN